MCVGPVASAGWKTAGCGCLPRTLRDEGLTHLSFLK